MHTKLVFPLWFVLVDEPVREPIQQPEEMSLRSSNPTEYHEYIYASGKLLREIITTTSGTTTSTEVLDFVYGSGSTPLALVYTNGTASPVTYYYITNIQGDVVKMVNASGTTVASYTYDAWGRVLSAEGDMAEVNPIRYRGYYYDAETELYYLQSRYYDPAVKRFVNADALMYAGIGFLGYNVYSYCCNSPVQYSDGSGYKIVPAEGTTNEQWQQYRLAIEYLKQSARARAIIEALESSETTFTIQFIDDNKTRYQNSSKTIFFDPNAGLEVYNCKFSQKGDAMDYDDTIPLNGIQSPAMGLIHEMGHALQRLNKAEDAYSHLGSKGATAALEADNLRYNESVVAAELNEPTRNHYTASRYYVHMTNSTPSAWYSAWFVDLRLKLGAQEL